MPGLTTRLADGWQRALRSLRLALVPMVLALTNIDGMRSIVAFDGVHVGFRFGVPGAVVTVWQFVSLPQTGVNVDPGVPLEALPVAVATVPLLLVVQAGLSAGYFGSLADELVSGDYRFVENVVSYFGSFLILTVVPVAVLLPPALGLVGLGASTGGEAALGAVFVLGALVYLVVAYLFYPVPYLVVLRDTGLVAAAGASYALAVGGGAYLSYTVGIALFVFVVSPVVTVVVVNAPVVGVPIGIVAGGVLGLAVNTATMRFVADIDPASPAVGEWDGDDEDRDETGSGAERSTGEAPHERASDPESLARRESDDERA
ncbi:hypothetical protein [Salinigranum marinum]|uniref:hypothetical protein n=1 Tax=Salinigranum marinum TaxID=1515595 RepID=UPI002989CE05|nr:hypothetical protein [Salinigranum marinum]